MKKLVLIILLMLIISLPVSANEQEDMFREQLRSSNAEELWDDLPTETRSFLEQLGITELTPDSITSISPNNVLNNLIALLAAQSGGPMRSMGILMGSIVLFALVDGTRHTVKEQSISGVFGAVCGLVICTALLLPLSECIRRVCESAQSVSVFMMSFVPVYAGVMISTGNPATAASYQTIVLFAAELISLLATGVIVPLMTTSLALGMTGSIAPEYRLGSAGELINKACGWMLGLGATLFAGLLSVQSLIGKTADSVTGRMVKFSVGSFVPVVGGALSEALSTVQSCLNLLKSTLGGLGIIVTALTVLPPLAECILWLLTLSVCTMMSETFSLNTAAALFKAAQSVLRLLIAVLTICAVFMIIATSIVSGIS